MKNTPTMISGKDLDYISDIFKWSLTASKKTNHFKDEVSDTKLKNILEKIAKMHTSHCEKIANIIK